MHTDTVSDPTRFLAADLTDGPLPDGWIENRDSMTTVPDGLQYAASVIATALDMQAADALDLFFTQSSRLENAAALTAALEERRRGRHTPYRVAIEPATSDAVYFMIHPRPPRYGMTADDPFDPASSIAVIEPYEDESAQAESYGDMFAQLTELQEKHRVLYEILPIGVTITDDQGVIIEVNEVCERILGIPASMLLGASIHDDSWTLIRPDGTPMSPQDFACVRVLRDNEPLLGQEAGFIRQNGEIAWISIFAAPISLEGYGVAIIYMDVTKSRSTEQRLRKREQRYRMAADAGHIGVWEWNMITDEIYLDLTLKHMIGYEDHEIKPIRSDWGQHVHAGDKQRAKEAVDRHLSGETPYLDVEHRMLHKNGSVVWVLSRGIASFDEEGNPVSMTGTHLDITERKLAEEALEVERRRLFSLLDRLPAFVCLIASDKSLRFKNRYFVEQFNNDDTPPCTKAYPNDSLFTCPTFAVFDTRSLAVWEWTYAETGQVFQIYDYPFEDVDGSPLVLELGIDVTVSRRALEALQESEQRYRSITDNLAMGIAMVDSNFHVVAANPKLREWFSHINFSTSPPCNVLLPDCESASFTTNSCASNQDGIPQAEMLREVPLPHGTRALRYSFCPISQGGELGSIILMIEDVTDRLRDQARLQRAQKLEAMGTLAGGIAHEINQPLNALRLYVSSLDMLVSQNESIDRDLVRKRLALIMHECHKINEIIVHMRSLVRQEKRGISSVNLNEALESALSLLTAQLKSHEITLRLDLQEGLPTVHANPVQVEQVVINLVVNSMNALDAFDEQNCKEGATIALPQVMEQPEKFVYIQTRHEADHVILSVQDNGPGFAGMEDRLFDPFFTTKDPGKGMGLGLSIVHTMVRSWDAEITAGQSPWGGAAFTVRLRSAD